MGTQVGYNPGNFYVLRVSEGFAIHLSLKLVTELTAQISRAGSKSPPGELRGILLGRTIDKPFRAAVIEDFKLLAPSEGPAQAGSEDALFEIGCRLAEAGGQRRALGFFRAQRDGSLSMGERDQDTFSRLFGKTGNIALLIQTPGHGSESEAALFYWQDGDAQPSDFGFGFPFETGQLASGHPGWRYPNPIDRTEPAAPLAAQPAAPKRTRAPFVFSRECIRWSRLLATAALVVIGIGALQLAMNSNRTLAAAPAATQTMPASAAPVSETALGLKVTPHPGELEIRWHPKSAAIAASEKGMMKITDAGTTQTVPLDQYDLRDGYVLYTPTTSDVSIRFEVTSKDGGTSSESVRVVAIP